MIWKRVCDQLVLVIRAMAVRNSAVNRCWKMLADNHSPPNCCFPCRLRLCRHLPGLTPATLIRQAAFLAVDHLALVVRKLLADRGHLPAEPARLSADADLRIASNSSSGTPMAAE